MVSLSQQTDLCKERLLSKDLLCSPVQSSHLLIPRPCDWSFLDFLLFFIKEKLFLPNPWDCCRTARSEGGVPLAKVPLPHLAIMLSSKVFPKFWFVFLLDNNLGKIKLTCDYSQPITSKRNSRLPSKKKPGKEFKSWLKSLKEALYQLFQASLHRDNK